MDTWTLQTGFPVITVKRDYDEGSATLTQVTINVTIDDSFSRRVKILGRRFYISSLVRYIDAFGHFQDRFLLRSRATDTKSEEKPLWWVPITYTSQNELEFDKTRPSRWMAAERSITLNNLKALPTEWMIFNVQETGTMNHIKHHYYYHR